MTFSFRYKPIKLKSDNVIYRPLIPFTLEGKDEKIDFLAMLDSGSDISIIPREIAETLGIQYGKNNEITGISGSPVNSKEGKIKVIFGKGREIYHFEIPILVPIDNINVPIIIGRAGFFEQFRITFLEAERRIDFKKFVKKY